MHAGETRRIPRGCWSSCCCSPDSSASHSCSCSARPSLTRTCRQARGPPPPGCRGHCLPRGTDPLLHAAARWFYGLPARSLYFVVGRFRYELFDRRRGVRTSWPRVPGRREVDPGCPLRCGPRRRRHDRPLLVAPRLAKPLPPHLLLRAVRVDGRHHVAHRWARGRRGPFTRCTTSRAWCSPPLCTPMSAGHWAAGRRPLARSRTSSRAPHSSPSPPHPVDDAERRPRTHPRRLSRHTGHRGRLGRGRAGAKTLREAPHAPRPVLHRHPQAAPESAPPSPTRGSPRHEHTRHPCGRPAARRA